MSETNGKRTRVPANNNKAANIAVDTVEGMRDFVAKVIEVTANDEPSPMYNSSGFRCPGDLIENANPDTLARLGSVVIHALDAQAAAGGRNAEAARNFLAVLTEYATSIEDTRKQSEIEKAEALLEANGRKVVAAR